MSDVDHITPGHQAEERPLPANRASRLSASGAKLNDVTKTPVADWETDFDHTDPVYAARAPEIWDELRPTCPVAHSHRNGGMWLPTRHADVAAIAHDTEHFSSESVIVSPFKPVGLAPMGFAPPITSDPPFHAFARRLLLPFPAANRDPKAFDRADEFVIDRARNRHLAFGLGIHRCLGSNLARLELTVALEEWLRRVPDFEPADPTAVRWSGGQVRGPRTLPIRLLETTPGGGA